MSAQVDSRRADRPGVERRYYYRRSLSMRELGPAIGAAAGAAALTFYLVKLLMERTPLEREPAAVGAPSLSLHPSGRSQATAKHIGRR